MKQLINVIMPMCGKGERMQGIGQDTCKPLMRLPSGECFFMKALQSLSQSYEIRNLMLVVLEPYLETFAELVDSISKPEGIDRVGIWAEPVPTKNPVETVQRGLRYMDECFPADMRLPLVILDCDIFSVLPRIELPPDDWFGALFTFTDDTGNKSYVVADDSGVAVDIAEKKMISNDAIFGAYYCQDVRAFQRTIVKKECEYVSEVFARNIDKKIKVVSLPNKVINFGTIQEFNNLQKDEI